MPLANARGALTTSMSDIYTAPAAGAKVTMIQIANIDGANDVDVTVQWTSASNGGMATRLAFNATVKKKDALSIPAGGLLLLSGDKIQASASAGGDAEITVCAVT